MLQVSSASPWQSADQWANTPHENDSVFLPRRGFSGSYQGEKWTNENVVSCLIVLPLIRRSFLLGRCVSLVHANELHNQGGIKDAVVQ